MDETTVSMHGMAIWDTGEVLFSPPPAILNRLPYKGQVDDRYLYRIYDQNSHGYTSDRIAFSRDIDQGTPECLIDVFARENRQAAADMLFRHLEFTSRDDTRTDNFVSWTSSLLFALKYAFYRAKINASSVEDIRLCIIDTTKFVKGSFMRDWDLMTAFSSADPRLQGFRKLRERKHKHYAGVYYFGEYLSQGRLSLRNKCSVVALSDMIKAKLPTLLPDLFLTDVNRKLLINSVIALREGWNSNSKNDGGPGWVTEKEVTAAVSIGKLFGLRFKMPVALSLLALQPRREADDMIMECFTGLDFRGEPTLLENANSISNMLQLSKWSSSHQPRPKSQTAIISPR